MSINDQKIKQMKNLILVVAIIAGLSTACNAQTTTGKEKKKTTGIEMKDHVCTDACHKSRQCVYTHGEKGHSCTVECAKMSTKSGKPEMKDHVCASVCIDGKHVYGHGEKGHSCADVCKKE